MFIIQITTLLAGDIKPDAIGVISPYLAQTIELQAILGENKVEVSTVDKYQGRDKDCIIVSLVRSNTERRIGSLLRDWRRINVAFTRAKKKLILIGSETTLNGVPIWQEVDYR